jgi:tRNA pseudouridine55 synthase
MTPSDGILLLNKPQGLSSNAALQRVKRLFSIKKAGHTGSLDPLATGMLPLCFGEATKIAQYLLNADKCYQVVGRLGQTTDTGDAMGVVTHETDAKCTQEELLKILPTLMGETAQRPPMYSALKHQGKPLYTYARKGVDIARAERAIHISQLDCTAFHFPHVELTVRCSKGTYIRSLIETIGERLGLGAHVTQLHRVYTAGFENMRMYTLDELADFNVEERMACLLPISRAIIQFPVLTLTAEQIQSLRQGKILSNINHHKSQLVQLHTCDGVYVGIGECREDHTLIAKRLCAF